MSSALITSPNSPGASATVLVVDDHRAFAELLVGALANAGMHPVGTATSAAEAIALVRDLRPDIVVMDIQLTREDGLAATRRIHELYPATSVAILTAHRDPSWVVRAAQAGASGFIPKTGSLEEMIDVLGRLRAGQLIVAPSAFTGTMDLGSPSAPPLDLTPRERAVLQALGRGLPAKSIARVLGISLETCRGYLKSLYSKLGVQSQLEAVIRGQELGLIAPPTPD